MRGISLGHVSFNFIDTDTLLKQKMEVYSACYSEACVLHLIIYCGLPCTSARRDPFSGCRVFKYEYTIIYPVPFGLFPFLTIFDVFTVIRREHGLLPHSFPCEFILL